MRFYFILFFKDIHGKALFRGTEPFRTSANYAMVKRVSMPYQQDLAIRLLTSESPKLKYQPGNTDARGTGDDGSEVAGHFKRSSASV